MNIHNKVSKPNTSIADKLARAAQDYSSRANRSGGRMAGPMMGGLAGGLASRGALGGRSGGLGAAPGQMSGGGLGAAAVGLSSEAAREMLEQNKGRLGAFLTGALQRKAGPVR